MVKLLPRLLITLVCFFQLGKIHAEMQNDIDTLATDTSIAANNYSLTFLTAASFDFSSKLNTSFLGLLNVFAPNLYGSKFGIITGIEKINYNNNIINGNDSTQVQFFTQYYLLDPLKVNHAQNTVNAGAKYVQRYNQYTFSASNTLWSFYLQPVFQLKNFRAKFNEGLYAHLHCELLINQWTRTANIKTLHESTDTGNAGTLTPSSNFYWVEKDKIVSNNNFVSTYLGSGLTLFSKLFQNSDNSFIFAQITGGYAYNTPDFNFLNDRTVTLNQNGTYAVKSVSHTNPIFFALFKVHLIQQINASSHIIVGFDYRQMAKTMPQYAAYIGLNLKIDSVAKLLLGT